MTISSTPNQPPKQTVILEGDDLRLRIEHNAPLPVLRPDEVLVRTMAVALNPCDYKMHERFPSPGAIDGCDFSGIILAIGSAVPSLRVSFEIGDRVFGAVHGSNPIRHESGSFAEYIASEAQFTLKIPDSMSFEEAAALGGTGLATLGMALFRTLELPGTPEEPAQNPQTVLVHGGSSSVGTIAMQLLRLVGHVPITTCSPRNWALAKEYGAEEVFDYHEPECAQKIKAYSRNTLRYVLDPFTDAKSIALCCGAMGRAGGRYACLEMHPEYLLEKRTLKVGFVMGPALLGHRLELDYGYEREADLEMRQFGVRWYRSIQWLLDHGRLRPHPLRVLPGRFDAILQGIEMLKSKSVSGEKLVVVIGNLATIAVASIIWRRLSIQPPVSKDALAHIPEVRFDENDTPERYTQDSRSLLFKCYDKYLRHGIPVQMRNPIGELGPQVLLPMKYLDEVKYASTHLFSFPLFSEKVFLLNYSDAPQQTDAAAHVVRVQLTKNLGMLANGMYQEAVEGLQANLPDSKGCSPCRIYLFQPSLTSVEWNTVPAYSLLANVTARVTALALVGPELCRNREWIDISLQTTFAIFNAAFTIRAKYSPGWRWLARWQSDAPRKMRAMRARAVELLTPCDKPLARIADEQLFLTVASMHTTSSSLTSVLYDLLIRPEYCAEITQEVQDALAECGGNWTLQQVAKMKKLDSFMKESQRVHPIGFITAQRATVRSHTFKDGLHLPAGVIFQFPADAVHHDPEIYPDPNRFDGYRFLRLRETVDPNRFHFASVSDTMLGFGAGSHACPGRFFTALAIKLILVVLLTQYEVKLADSKDGCRPPDTFHDFNMGPSQEAQIMLRKKFDG
ncbi:hypothetical protein CNMCM7691_001816 [Aspergillus felis]|uniref:Enoyl reductase (ER) domain-containing protein n=1 Tax=Aspergillus felis TaxID=1287682 RepID=A0A8H6R064_9EURO|nr:hypothetical protein CNMCM7691_001816 [Aspergillus felis]